MQPGETDHFRNGHFYNDDTRPGGFVDLIRWLRTRQPGAWRKWIPSSYGPKPIERLAADQLRVTFVGHSTVLIQAGAFNFLTDPSGLIARAPFSGLDPSVTARLGCGSRTCRPLTQF